ncbi:pH-response transcription factor [Penicillium taxi]|uniref:pH-response transcription factor n=1 Tax=Penicillium taxi TaxID=168475 RepID=UPI0025451316|nr:pH-response transcription factor [Penicillium taxi]KAJ5887863.1 pH-response transcription factor [Penicillium taxi]
MSDNNVASAASPQPVSAAPVEQNHINNINTTASVATAVAATAAVNNSLNTGGDQFSCQWVGCHEKAPSAEALYDHVCERHVGRKSTNNLNLTCQWGTCTTTTVKRDHITSHIRVHVPLKPHKCDFCGKAFKRPQDLKKHVKTHADDSDIRSPEPGSRPNPDIMYQQNPRGYIPAYSEGQNYNYPAPSAPAPQFSYHPAAQHAANPSYGNVMYSYQGPDVSQYNQASQKYKFDALNEFFGDLKRRQFDTHSYAAVSQRLNGLQALQLPVLSPPVPEYHQQMAIVGGPSSHAPAYHLPPLSEARHKSDFIHLEHMLEQVQNTIYESEDNIAAAGVAQPGAHYMHSQMHYRHPESPPSQLPPSHVTATAPGSMIPNSAQSPSVGTPALTPPSSAQSYTSARSPTSIYGHRVSPPHESSGGVYPRLPSNADSVNYSVPASAAPPSTLSGAFDNNDRRRFTGGTLQRARQVTTQFDKEVISDDAKVAGGERTPTQAHANISASLIDPALSSASPDPEQEAARRTAQAATEVAERDVNFPWVDKVRLIESLRDWIAWNIKHASWDHSSSASPSYSMDGAMDVDASTRASSIQKDEPKSEPEAILYPTLRLDEDGDSKMPSAE